MEACLYMGIGFFCVCLNLHWSNRVRFGFNFSCDQPTRTVSFNPEPRRILHTIFWHHPQPQFHGFTGATPRRLVHSLKLLIPPIQCTDPSGVNCSIVHRCLATCPPPPPPQRLPSCRESHPLPAPAMQSPAGTSTPWKANAPPPLLHSATAPSSSSPCATQRRARATRSPVAE